MSVLVIADHDNGALKATTAKILAAVRPLAQGAPCDVLVIGHNVTAVAQEVARCPDINNVLLCQHEKLQYPIADYDAPVIQHIAKEEGPYRFLVAPSTTEGKNTMPRVAALMDCDMLSDVIDIIDATTIKRPIYAGNAIETIRITQETTIMTIRATAFEAQGAPSDTPQSAIKECDVPSSVLAMDGARFVGKTQSDSERPELTSARIVISGGRGLQSADHFALLERLADTLGAALGASRAAVDAGYAPNDWQVGQTGKIVAPDLYIAVGISGAIQHLAGIKDARTIVAINKDEEAPIFQHCDYGLVGDLFDILPELTEKLAKKPS
ncbi:MAG: electron transfer flavoprotein subunit alpha/FixB family protein [Alphaproteobacteria bacterium GM7ARS4]|nr:electron transfer flavoprotein subunit alpha/FixB family protein [Alphaproteobacteria bacterium GM7ARS4]